MSAITHSPRTEIELFGQLGKKLGKVHQRVLDTGKLWEVFKALNVTLPGFKDEVERLQRLGMRFAIYRNGENVGVDKFGLGGAKTIRIVPVISGSKRAGLLQTILGVILIAASPFTNGATLAPGIALAAGGVIQMLSPQASGLKQSASPENSPSYSFGSARNTTASGNPVPICIGERRWGGMIISASIYAEDKA